MGTTTNGRFRFGQNGSLPRALTVVVGIRVVAAIIFFAAGGQMGFAAPDSGLYGQLATGLLHGTFGTSGVPQAYRPPGYPLLLVPAVASGHVLVTGVALNFILAALSAVFVWQITLDLVDTKQAAFWATVLFGLEPVGLLLSEELLSETLFVTVLLLGLRTLLQATKSGWLRPLAASAVVFAATAYVRPAAEYLPVFLAPALLLCKVRKLYVAAFVAIFAACLAPWIIRNHFNAHYNGFSGTTTENARLVAATVRAKVSHVPVGPVYMAVANGGDEDESIVWKHPFLYAMIHARGCATVMLDPESLELLKRLNLYPREGGMIFAIQDSGVVKAFTAIASTYAAVLPVSVALWLFLGFYYLEALRAWELMPRNGRILLVSICAYFVLVSGVPGAVGRYRAPIMPLVCIAAGTAVAHKRSTANKSLATQAPT